MIVFRVVIVKHDMRERRKATGDGAESSALPETLQCLQARSLSLNAMAAKMDARGGATDRKWTPTAVKRVLDRL
jgi:hypothetical protein